jgi:rhodanese-related sulfurtransferase
MSAFQTPEIDVHELARKLRSGESFVLLDVREGWELDQAMIEDARTRVVPMSRLAQLGRNALPEEMEDKGVKVLVLCHHGVRSANATAWLREQGWIAAYSVRGGIAEYARLVDRSVGRY